MRWLPTLLWLIAPWLALAQPPGQAFKDDATEGLRIRPLPDGKVALAFEFTILSKDKRPRHPKTLGQDDESQHYELFPLALGQILREYAVTEMHLTLNSGRWMYDRWSYPDSPGVAAGAELWAWMGDGGPISVDERWQGLNNALAGLFCASLSDLPNTRTSSPEYAFRPEGFLPRRIPHHLRHAVHPSEQICTENLTPFLKLLPCKGISGLASLLNPHKLFDGDWHGIGVHVTFDPDKGVQVRLTVGAVLDPVRATGTRNWSFESLFGRNIEKRCIVMRDSHIRLQQRPDIGVAKPSPYPDDYERGKGSESWDRWTVRDGFTLNSTFVDEEWSYPLSSMPAHPATQVTVIRSLRGSDQTRGGLTVNITNHLDAPQRVYYVETMPWIIKFYLHTLTTLVDSEPRSDVIQGPIAYIPSNNRTPTLLEMPLLLPALSEVQLSIDFEKVFLKYTEHPPDAQRGWDLPGAVVIPYALPSDEDALRAALEIQKAAKRTIVDEHGEIREVGEHIPIPKTLVATDVRMRIYTPPLLADLATPDFSMPYNVIIMVGALVAYLFGSVFNLLTRKFVLVRVGEKSKAKGVKVVEK